MYVRVKNKFPLYFQFYMSSLLKHLFYFIYLYLIYLQPNSNFIYYNNINLSKPTGYVMHQQFNIQQLYVLPTLYWCVLYLSENKERLVPLTA